MLDRRTFLIASPFVVAGCVPQQAPVVDAGPVIDSYYLDMYASVPGEPHDVPAVDLTEIDPRFLRREVAYPTRHAPGTIVVDIDNRYAYLVRPNGRAIRYGVGVGKQEAYNLTGVATVGRKAAWPGWTPTQSMIRREPDRYGPYAKGLPGGATNPLGARALYLYRNGTDTLYRLHGTNEPWTIGTTVSSGCIRFMNQDIMDLHRRVPSGTTVVILPATRPYGTDEDGAEGV